MREVVYGEKKLGKVGRNGFPTYFFYLYIFYFIIKRK